MALNEADVTSFVTTFQDLYNKKDAKFFDCFDKDATFFTVSSPTRIDGLEEYRRGFEPYFTQPSVRRGQILSPEIRIIGDSAIVTYHNRIVIDNKVTNLQVSLVVGKDPAGFLKVFQYHNSTVERPSVPLSYLGVGARSLDEISMLEERVATAASVCGTPK